MIGRLADQTDRLTASLNILSQIKKKKKKMKTSTIADRQLTVLFPLPTKQAINNQIQRENHNYTHNVCSLLAVKQPPSTPTSSAPVFSLATKPTAMHSRLTPF